MEPTTHAFTVLPHVGELNHPDRVACDANNESCDQLATFAYTEWQGETTREGIYNLCTQHATERLAVTGQRVEGL